MPDVAHDFTPEIALGTKDAAGDDVALDLGEPDFHLIEPRGVGRGVVDAHARVGLQESGDGLGFVRGKIVSDDVNFLALVDSGHQLAQESDELHTGVAAGSFAQDFSARRLQGGVERERAVAVVFEPVPLGPAGREWQHRVEAIEGLDGGLFIHTEDGSVNGWPEVEADDVRGLRLEVGVVTGHVVTPAVGLQATFGPDSCDPDVVDSERRGQLAAAPLRAAVSGLAVERPVDDPRLDLCAALFDLPSTVPAKEPGQARLDEAIPPFAHRVHTAAFAARDLPHAGPRGGKPQDDSGAPHIFETPSSAPAHTSKSPPLRRAKNDAICHG